MSFVRAPNPVWFFVDLNGQPLNDEYYAFFLTNTLPYLPQNVYRDDQGVTIWTGNVVEFFPNGTLPDNLFFDPNLVYRIEIRHGNSQTDPLIDEINNFVPCCAGMGGGSATFQILSALNQISNPNFSQISFVSPHTITTAGTYDIAPGYQLTLVGTGTTVLTQLIFAPDAITTAPNALNYALRINNIGWSSAILFQRFNNNGAIFSKGALSMMVTARAEGVSELISLIYKPSSGDPVQVVSNADETGLLTTGDYRVVQGTVNMPQTTNNDLSSVAYVDMEIVLPSTGTVDITDFQVVGQSDPIPFGVDPLDVQPIYQQESQERIIDHLFHYYAQELIIKPKKSLLVGWNFPLNPYQFITTTVTTVANQTQYIADQTIIHQEAASQLQSGANSVDQRKNLLIKAVTAAATTRFALIQYIDSSTIRPYWSYIVSSLVRARLTNANSSPVKFKMRLIYRSSVPSAISNTEPISSWAADSDPVFAAGWTALAPLNDPEYTLTNTYSTDETSGGNSYPTYAFDSFQLPNADNAFMTLGIVVYTMDNLDSVAASENSVEWDKISLIPDKFAADAFPSTFDESLRECQYYYRKSYAQGTTVASTTFNGSSATVSVTGYAAGVNFYSERYINMRTPGTVVIYNPMTGTANSMHDLSTNTELAVTAINIGDASFILQTVDAVPGSNNQLGWHYTVDARLGV